MKPDEQAEWLAEAFFNSGAIAEAVTVTMEQHKATPLEALYAIAVFKRFLHAQVPMLPELERIVLNSMDLFDKEGMLPICNPDGSISPPPNQKWRSKQ